MNTETNATPAVPEASVAVRVPRVDIWRGDDGYRVIAELPGASAESIKVTAEAGTLRLDAEAPRTRWRRSFELPEATDVDAIEARYERGLLTITLPCVATARSRQIRVVSA